MTSRVDHSHRQVRSNATDRCNVIFQRLRCSWSVNPLIMITPHSALTSRADACERTDTYPYTIYPRISTHIYASARTQDSGAVRETCFTIYRRRWNHPFRAKGSPVAPAVCPLSPSASRLLTAREWNRVAGCCKVRAILTFLYYIIVRDLQRMKAETFR